MVQIMKFSHKIKSETGLHGRAAAKIVDKCKEFNSIISVVYNGKIGNANSVVSLVSIEAKQDDMVNVIIEGADEVSAYNGLKSYFMENL